MILSNSKLSTQRHIIVLILGFILVSFNTRVPFGQIGLLAPFANLNEATITFLGVIPPLGMGISAPLVPMLLRRVNGDHLLLWSSILAFVGAVIRLIGISGLIWGTLLISLAIGIINVLIPIYARHRFSHSKLGAIFGIYALSMGTGSAITAAAVVPLAETTGSWVFAAGTALITAILAVIGSVMMLDRQKSSVLENSKKLDTGNFLTVAKTWIAWSLTAFFGVQTFLFYALLAWIPIILISTGVSQASAGVSQAILIGGIALGGLFFPLLAARGNTQAVSVILVITLSTIGMLGIAIAPAMSAWLWIPILGFGLGGGQAIPAILYVHRGIDAAHTASFSAFAQTGGFLIAATGPILLSKAYNLFGNWKTPLILFSIICILNLALSWRATGIENNKKTV